MTSRVIWRILVGAVAFLTSASLAPPASGQVAWLEVEVVGGGPVFDLSALAPGHTIESHVLVRNLSGDLGTLSLTAFDIVDESGCSTAELKVGMPCGSGIGALGGELEFKIERLLPGGGLDPIWVGNIYDLAGVQLSSAVPGGVQWEYQLSAHLPVTSGNASQKDSLGFKLRFDLIGDSGGGGGTTGGDPPGSDTGGTDGPDDGGTDDGGDGGTDSTGGTDGTAGGAGGGGGITDGTDGTEVLGSVVTRPGAGGAQVLGLSLPRTGAEIARALLVAAAALLAGGTTLAATAQLRRRRLSGHN